MRAERERERQRATSLTVSQVKTWPNTLLFTDINIYWRGGRDVDRLEETGG